MEKSSAPICAAILAGGKSLRFGSDKALMSLRGEFALSRLIATLEQLFQPVFIVADQPEKIPPSSTTIVQDVIPDCGPLGGILTALQYSPTPRCFIAACDMPILDLDILRFLAVEWGTEDILIPKVDGEEQPLAAFYRNSCLPVVRDCLRQSKLSLRCLWDYVQVRYCDLNAHFHKEKLARCFANINTLTQLEHWQNRIGGF
ncbi:MAG: molybdenum cofactor guanylyltransferase [bacterium]